MITGDTCKVIAIVNKDHTFEVQTLVASLLEPQVWLPWILESEGTLDGSSKAIGTQRLGPRDQSRPMNICYWFLGVQLPRILQWNLPRIVASEKSMLVVQQVCLACQNPRRAQMAISGNWTLRYWSKGSIRAKNWLEWIPEVAGSFDVLAKVTLNSGIRGKLVGSSCWWSGKLLSLIELFKCFLRCFKTPFKLWSPYLNLNSLEAF